MAHGGTALCDTPPTSAPGKHLPGQVLKGNTGRGRQDNPSPRTVQSLGGQRDPTAPWQGDSASAVFWGEYSAWPTTRDAGLEPWQAKTQYWRRELGRRHWHPEAPERGQLQPAS